MTHFLWPDLWAMLWYNGTCTARAPLSFNILTGLILIFHGFESIEWWPLRILISYFFFSFHFGDIFIFHSMSQDNYFRLILSWKLILSIPIISLSGHLQNKTFVLFPGPQPNIDYFFQDFSTLIRAARSLAGWVRSSLNFK
jgi:hypothetical protein